jgi:hypothetical protein
MDLPDVLILGWPSVTGDGAMLYEVTSDMTVPFCRNGVFITAYPRAGSLVGGHLSS